MLESARQVFDIEIESLQHVRSLIGESFVNAAQAILRCHGKVIVTGLGKSGAVGRKIAATFSSTGTPALFLHATEGVHGDIGIVDKNDLVIAISYSGETGELSQILPAISRLGIPLIAITGAPNSSLARAAHIVLPVTVPKEACPLGLAPTSSTTATLVMGDALAVAVHQARGFTPQDFAFRHPGGALGRSLLSVSDLMHTGDEVPICRETASMSDVIIEMTRKKLGMTCIVDAAGSLSGIITDGDLRRLIAKNIDGFLSKTAASLMSRSPKTISSDLLAVRALTIMEDSRITTLVIVEAQGPESDRAKKPEGVIHIHDILRSKVI